MKHSPFWNTEQSVFVVFHPFNGEDGAYRCSTWVKKECVESGPLFSGDMKNTALISQSGSDIKSTMRYGEELSIWFSLY